MPQQPLALLGGTFDPVHLGHLRIAWEVAEALDAEVHLLLAAQPAHRARPIASVAQRVAALQAALVGQQRLQLDLRELRRAGPSYSIDTLREVRVEIGPQRALILLLGADAFAGLASWHHWRELFNFAHMVVLTRPGVAVSLADELRVEMRQREITQVNDLAARAAGLIYRLQVTALAISATQVREILAAGREPRYLVSERLLADPTLLEAYRNAATNLEI